MGRPSWATDSQRKWLDNKLIDYNEVQRLKTLTSFFTKMVASFFQDFPPSPTELDGGLVTEDDAKSTRTVCSLAHFHYKCS